MSQAMTVGVMLVRLLESYGVDTVFGIPGVHTAELYRGLATSGIHHVTPRDEQDAGFMADGYARVSGKPGVCLLITGPGLTNAVTPMAQARADSIPMLIISGVNALATLGRYEGHLHELPDQAAMIRTLALSSERLERPQDLPSLIERAFARMMRGRPGPVHIEIPTDLMEAVAGALPPIETAAPMISVNRSALEEAVRMCAASAQPLILAGGGAVRADAPVRALAEKLDAPVVTTTNGRGLLSGHPLAVPASPSLAAVRRLMRESDLIIAVGTQFGPTDYDAYVDGGFTPPENLIRIDIDGNAEAHGVPASVFINGDASEVTQKLVALLPPRRETNQGRGRAEETRREALASLSPKMKAMLEVLSCIRQTVPDATMVGDSTQLAYAGNLYWEASAPRRWFNAATGYGALGYGPPAAVGAGIALGRAPVVCLVGDGGFQFCLAALGVAKDEAAPVIFVVWNNHGYQEIEDYMVSRDITPIGVKPSAPDFTGIAAAYGIPAERIRVTEAGNQGALAPGQFDLAPLVSALRSARNHEGASLIEIIAP